MKYATHGNNSMNTGYTIQKHGNVHQSPIELIDVNDSNQLIVSRRMTARIPCLKNIWALMKNLTQYRAARLLMLLWDR